MAKLKPSWMKTDIPKRIKVILWKLIKDNPTYESWQIAISKSEFNEADDPFIHTSRDTFNSLKYEINHMPIEEVAGLPLELQTWIKQLRPELKFEEALKERTASVAQTLELEERKEPPLTLVFLNNYFRRRFERRVKEWIKKFTSGVSVEDFQYAAEHNLNMIDALLKPSQQRLRRKKADSYKHLIKGVTADDVIDLFEEVAPQHALVLRQYRQWFTWQVELGRQDLFGQNE